MVFLLLMAAAMNDAQLAAARTATPANVRALVDRWEACGHWAGEEPYDKDRARQIERAMGSLRCDRLERDEAAVRRAYARDVRIQRLLTAAHDLY